MLGGDPLDDAIGEMMIWTGGEEPEYLQPVFRVGPAIWSVALAAGPGAARLHFLVNPLLGGRFWDVFGAHDVEAEVDPGRAGGRFGVRLSYRPLDGGTMTAARSLEEFSSDVEAEFQASAAAEGLAAALHRTGGWEVPRGFNALPVPYHGNRLSAVVPASLTADRSAAALIARVLRQEAPAHLSLDLCAASATELAIADAGIEELDRGANGDAAAALRRLLARFARMRLFPESPPVRQA